MACQKFMGVINSKYLKIEGDTICSLHHLYMIKMKSKLLY